MMNKHLICGLALLALAQGALSQHIEGVVLREDGAPFAGVTVFLEGTAQGDMTDKEGRYAIRAPGPGAYLLVASHVGFSSDEWVAMIADRETVAAPPLILHPSVTSLGEIVVEARRAGSRRRLKLFTANVLGRTTVARKARLINPEALSFTQVRGGFTVEASEPLIVENAATGFRIRVFLHRYQHHARTGGYQYAGRLFFEEMGEATARQLKTRERLYKGSMKHFLKAWRQGRTHEEGFYTHGDLERPRYDEGAAYAERRGAILVEYDGRPDGAYRAHLTKSGVAPPFSKTSQVSRIAFINGAIAVAQNGFPLGPVRQEGYWAFRGVGDAAPAPMQSAVGRKRASSHSEP